MVKSGKYKILKMISINGPYISSKFSADFHVSLTPSISNTIYLHSKLLTLYYKDGIIPSEIDIYSTLSEKRRYAVKVVKSSDIGFIIIVDDHSVALWEIVGKMRELLIKDSSCSKSLMDLVGGNSRLAVKHWSIQYSLYLILNYPESIEEIFKDFSSLREFFLMEMYL